MSYPIDFDTATSEQIERALCARIEDIRLSRNLSQAKLAEDAQVSERTIRRLLKGQGVSFDTLIRVLLALRVQHNLETLLPDPSVRPVERVARAGKPRQRASSTQVKDKSTGWTWGDGVTEDD